VLLDDQSFSREPLDPILVDRASRARRQPWILEVSAVRQRLGDAFSSPSVGGSDFFVDAAGRAPIRVRKYEAPANDGRREVIAYVHGGGWVGNSVDTHDGVCSAIRDESRQTVYSVEYSRAPEATYPIAALEVATVIEWLTTRGLRPLVAGDSSGATLALSGVLHVDSRQLNEVRGLLLFYPMVDPSSDWPSYEENREYCGITREAVRWFWDQYIGKNPTDVDDPRLRPLLLSDEQLPPIVLVVSDYDILRDEGLALGHQLANAGRAIRTILVPAVNHGYLRTMEEVPVARKALQSALRVADEIALKAPLNAVRVRPPTKKVDSRDRNN